MTTISKQRYDNFMQFMESCYRELGYIVPFDKNNLFVSGGYFIRRFLGLPIRDIDVFVSRENYNSVLEQYFDIGYSCSIFNKNGDFHTLKNSENNFSIDLIGFHNPNNFSCIRYFDFNLCQIAMDEINVYICSHYVLNELFDKQLRFTGFCYRKTIRRLVKYLKFGLEIDNVSLENITSQLLSNDLTNNAHKVEY